MDRHEIAPAVPPLVVQPHPFTTEGRTLTVAAFLPHETLGAYVERVGIALPRSKFRVQHNGRYVPDALWERLIPRTGDQIVIHAVPQGGGGGKILRTVAMIALVVVANVYGGALGTALGLTGKVALGVGSAIIMVGGSLLINALLPVPNALAADYSGSKYDTVPSYALSGGRNSARLYEPMMLVFGKHRVVPDLGAGYFTEYVGDTQYLNQVFHFGMQLNEVTSDTYKIGDTPVENFQGVQLQLPDPNTGALSLFPGNVDTIPGFTLNSGVVNSRTTAANTTHIAVELASTLFYVNDQGGVNSRSVELRIQYRPVGGAWTDIGLLQDAIYATHYWALMQIGEIDMGNVSARSETQVSYGSLNPADHTDGESVVLKGTGDSNGDYWRPAIMGVWRWKTHPFQRGRPWAGIAPDPLIGYSSAPGVRLSGATQKVTRQTVSWSVAPGQYEVKIWKVTGDIANSRESNETAVNQILCRQPDTGGYAGQRRLACRIQATSQLNGAINEFSAMVYAWAHVWDGTNWVWQHTSNPAWWFLWFARGKTDDAGRRIYGGGYADAEIDIEAIKAWGAWCAAKGLEFNFVLAQQKSVDEVLAIIARAGRASVTRQTGKLGVIWDAANQPVVAMFGPFNIKAGSFKVAYVNSTAIPDEVVLTFADRDQDYQANQVRVLVPGAARRFSPVTLDLDGCTSAAQAGREANLIAASQVWHRRRTSWETDIEGFVASRGDVVQISHDLTVWGYSGRLVGRSGNMITLSQAIPIGSGTMLLRDPEGTMKTVVVSGAEGETDTVTITTDMTDFALPGDAGYEDVPAMDWAFMFDPLATPGRRFKIVDVQPSGDGVRFEAVDDDPEYYASENDPYSYTPPRDGALLAGKVLSLTFAEGYYNTLAKRLDLYVSWAVSSSVATDVIVTLNGTAQPPVRTSDRGITIPNLSRGDVVIVSVTPIGLGKGTPLTQTHTIQAVAVPPSAVTGLTAVVDGARIRLVWSPNAEPDIVDYEVRSTDSGWGAIGALFVGDATRCLVDAPAPGASGTWYVRAANGAGLYSETSAIAALEIDVLPNVAAIRAEFADTSLTNATITLSWDAVAAQLGTKGYRVTYADESQDIDATRVTLPADWIGDRTFTVQTVDAAGNVSSGASRTITKLVPAVPTGLRAQVIDNNVLLYWTLPEATTLPVDHVRVKEGEAWATAREIGSKKGSFTSLAELEAGRKTYWLCTVDTDGWESPPVSIAVEVSQPPDFVFRGTRRSALDGALTSAYRASDGVYLPVESSETWAGHFSARSWDGPQDQIDAGYPYFLQPTPTPGTYREVFDFDTLVASSRITVALDGTAITGSPVVETTLETSQDGATWGAPNSGTETFATNFRYVRFTVNVTQSADTAIYRINRIDITLSSKLKNDAGSITAVAADALGTVANFNVDFLDISSITLSAAGTEQRSAVYDFKDDIPAGSYSVSSGVVTASVTAHGLIAGQDVMLNFANRAPERARIVTAATNSFTALTDGPDGSGSLQIYPQSFRVYLFDNSGARVSGAVSWAAKGN